MANKQDIKESIPAHEISQRLDLDQLKSYVHRYNILPCTALTPPNRSIDSQIRKGLTWLVDAIDEDFEQLGKRVEKERKESEQKEKMELAEKKKFLMEKKACQEQEAKEASEQYERNNSC